MPGTTRQLAYGSLPFPPANRLRSLNSPLGACSLRLVNGQYVRPEDPLPCVADENHQLTCGNGVRVNALRLLPGPFGQVVDVRKGRIGQDQLLPQSVLDDGVDVL